MMISLLDKKSPSSCRDRPSGTLFAVHGGWTSWSTWSECSPSCGGNSVKTRRRTCTSPQPRSGGRTCVGEDIQISDCHLPPCRPDGSIETSLYSQAKFDFQVWGHFPAPPSRSFLIHLLLSHPSITLITPHSTPSRRYLPFVFLHFLPCPSLLPATAKWPC